MPKTYELVISSKREVTVVSRKRPIIKTQIINTLKKAHRPTTRLHLSHLIARKYGYISHQKVSIITNFMLETGDIPRDWIR